MSRIVFTHANVLDGEHAARPDSSVVVEGDRIVEVTSGAVATGPDDRVIDCSGRTLMPGMTTGHYHSTYHNVTVPLPCPLGLESPPAYQAYTAAHNVGLALRGGFTSVVGANEAWDIDPSLKQAIADGLLLGPRVIAGCAELITTADSNDITPWWWDAKGRGGTRVVDGPDEFRKAVREEIKRGAEIIKIFATGGHGVRLSRNTMSITREEMHAVVEAAHNLDTRVRAHVASKAGVLACLEAGVDIIDHGDGIDEEVIEKMVEADVCYEPSVHSHYIFALMIGDTEFQSEFGEVYRATCAMLPKAAEADLHARLGDDYGSSIQPHGSYGKEIPFYVEQAGIEPLEVLKWATVNGGALVGLPDLGRVQEGYLADIIVVEGDPSVDINLLGDVENIVGVMRDGQLLIDNGLDAGQREHERELVSVGE